MATSDRHELSYSTSDPSGGSGDQPGQPRAIAIAMPAVAMPVIGRPSAEQALRRPPMPRRTQSTVLTAGRVLAAEPILSIGLARISPGEKPHQPHRTLPPDGRKNSGRRKRSAAGPGGTEPTWNRDLGRSHRPNLTANAPGARPQGQTRSPSGKFP